MRPAPPAWPHVRAGVGRTRYAYHRGMLRTLIAAALLLTAAACGGPSASPSPAPSHTPMVTPTPVPTPTPTPAPDTEQVSITASGFGAYDLQVYPIAVLANAASAHTATGVTVSFTVQFSGGSYQLSTEPVSLGPGETLAVTALCTDACDGANAIQATPTVGGWATGPRVVISGSSAPYTCGSPCSGDPGYEGSVSGTLTGQVPSGTLVTVTAVCQNGAGNIVGGGSASSLWPAGTTAPAYVSVLTSTQPASCQLYATEVT